ncbi:cation diffusion facilitator family [Plasmopara halstedii]|uniref:Cation diffusion facilitator family n=1 Tax=Plasmopara halstedii TaxID=4781 RepID=A0A0P1B278_PLAHL|nr:cation diffusion facilitator family [Plasmopara halstedii]CEG47866.1 cation diffusion facilitator family [Plasmopara halstedii]|eukprot:XP_024584235.1 cation diffusion facilitator family [Plasmopara halstedii]
MAESSLLMASTNSYGTHTINSTPKNSKVSGRYCRSQVSHAFLLKKEEDAEVQHLSSPSSAALRVQVAINASLAANVVLTIVKIYAALTSGSLAVLSSLVDSILDLTSQALFWYSDKRMHTPSVKYPAGRRRLEPIAVIISATLMGMAAIEVIQQSVKALVKGFNGHLREIDISSFTLIVLLVAIVVKLFLWYICAKIASHSPSADALAQDHRNDVYSNLVAVSAAFVAHKHPSLWCLDSIGAIVISVYIAVSWLATGKEQVERLVGLQAEQEFIDHIRTLGDVHHPLMKTDIVRAYHFGNNYLVEMEVILPEDMCVKEAHDISLSLQIKVEGLDNVERAFVHVDYLERNYDEHKDPTLRRDSS